MKVFAIQNILSTKEYNKNNNRINNYNVLNNTSCDCFIKESGKVYSPRNVQFLGSIANISNEFQQKFPRTFFKKLLREGVPDAYSDITLIPLEDIDNLKKLGILNKKGSIAISHLKEYKEDMFKIEKEIFSILETLSKKNPNLTLQELIQLKFPQAELSLINQQTKILNKINIIIRKLPKSEYQETRKLIQTSFDKILEPNPTPEERFRRKDFLLALKAIEIKNSKVKNRIIKIAESLPQSSNNINAFIVKYSQPYKIRYNTKTGEYIRITRDSQELGLRLIEPSVGTDEHIYPQTRIDKEIKKWLEEDNNDNSTIPLKVTILTSKYMNNLKTDILLDDFIILEHPTLPSKIQNHVNRLIDIAEKWTKQGKLQDASTLCDYIKILQNEIHKRSNIVKIDLGNFEEKIPKIKERANLSLEKKQVKKRIKKQGHADNTHKETYTDNGGYAIENRKVQKHSSRFKQ